MVLGLVMIRKMIKQKIPWSTRDRVIIAGFGILGFAFWAGLLVGPTLAIIVSILPAALFS